MSDDTAARLLAVARALEWHGQAVDVVWLRALAKRMPVLEAADRLAHAFVAYVDGGAGFSSEEFRVADHAWQEAEGEYRAAVKAAEEAERAAER